MREGKHYCPSIRLLGSSDTGNKKAGSRIEENVEVNSQQNWDFFFESIDNVEQMKKQININLKYITLSSL